MIKLASLSNIWDHITIVSSSPASFYVLVLKPLDVLKHVQDVRQHSNLHFSISAVKFQVVRWLGLELKLFDTMKSCDEVWQRKMHFVFADNFTFLKPWWRLPISCLYRLYFIGYNGLQSETASAYNSTLKVPKNTGKVLGKYCDV